MNNKKAVVDCAELICTIMSNRPLLLIKVTKDPIRIQSSPILCIKCLAKVNMSSHTDSSLSEFFLVSSADVNPDHHVKILEALITVGGLTEMQAAPGRQILHSGLKYSMNPKHEEVLALSYQFPALAPRQMCTTAYFPS